MGAINPGIKVTDENEYELQEEKVPNEFTPCISSRSPTSEYEISGLRPIQGFDFVAKVKEADMNTFVVK